MKKIIALSIAALSMSAFAQVNLEQSPEVGATVAEYKSLPKKDKDELRDMMAAQMTKGINDTAKKNHDKTMSASVKKNAVIVNVIADKDSEKTIQSGNVDIKALLSEVGDTICKDDNVLFSLAVGVNISYRLVGTTGKEYGKKTYTNKECNVLSIN